MKKKKFFILLFFIVVLAIVLLSTVFYLIYKNNLKWHENNPLIAHALYGIDDNSYTNSYEALELGYSKGLRVFEADFLLTSDNYLVLNYVWENSEVLSYEEFMSHKIQGKYTPMDIKSLLIYLKEHKDIYIVVDTKQDMFDITKFFDVYSKIVEEANNIDSKLLNRFIIQIYNYEDLKTIKEIYDFKDYIFTIYKLTKLSILELTTFCETNNIDTLVFPYEYIYNRKLNRHDIKFIKDYNLKIYTHTINDEAMYEYFLMNGFDGVFTDFLY